MRTFIGSCAILAASTAAIAALPASSASLTVGARQDAYGRRAIALLPEEHVVPQRVQSEPGQPTASSGWENIGPYGGNARAVVQSPLNPAIVLCGIAGSAGGRLYRSTDSGSSWAIVPDIQPPGCCIQNGVYDVEFDSRGFAYAGTILGLWKSTDSGTSWNELELGIGLQKNVVEISIDPSNADKLWIGISDAQGTQPIVVMKSTDAGTTWLNATPPLLSPMTCYGVGIDLMNSNKVYACFGGFAGGGKVWASINGGNSWIDRSSGLPNRPLFDILHDGTRVLVCGGQLFGGQSVGVYASYNGGSSWVPLHGGGWPSLAINDLEVDPNNHDTILAASAGAGVFRSTDGGVTWGFGIGGTTSLSVNSVRFAQTSGTIYLGGSTSGVLRSTDGGANFATSSKGIAELNIRSIDVNPTNTSELAVGVEGENTGGVYTSTDGGQTWALSSAPPTRYNAVKFAPNGVLHAISGGPSTVAPEGIYRRQPNGTWTGLGPDQGPLFESELWALEFSARNPSLLLASGKDFGVAGAEATIWYSTTAGTQWAKVYEGTIANQAVGDLELIEDGGDSVVVAALAMSYFGTGEGGVLRSYNGGATWAPSLSGLDPGTQGASLAASPREPRTVYLLDRLQTDTENRGGIHVSQDAGRTWMSTGYMGSVLVEDIECNHNGHALYIAVHDSPFVLRSRDQGASFEAFGDGLSFFFGPQDMAYAAGAAPRLLLATVATSSYARQLDEVVDAGPGPRGVPGLALWQDSGGPASQRLVLAFALPSECAVTLAVFDVRGRLLRTALHAPRFPAGEHSWEWDLRDERNRRVSPGVYFCRLATQHGSRSIRSVVVGK